MQRRTLTGLGLAVALSTAAWAPALGDETPLRLIVPFAPGGSADQIARLVATPMGQRLGLTIVVDNKPGAGGIVAADLVAKSAADGKTLLVGSNAPLVINSAVYPKLPYDPERDFVPVIALAETPLLLLTRKGLPVKSVAELQTLARSRAATPLTMGSAGNGNITHLAGIHVSNQLGFKVAHVPYKGSAPAILALLAGEIDLMYDALPSSLQQAKAGGLQPLAVTSAQRLPALPGTPTLRELGFDIGKATAWFGLVAPAGTPAALVKKFNAAAQAALADPAIKERISAIGFEAIGGSADEFGATIASERQRWVPLARSLDVKAD